MVLTSPFWVKLCLPKSSKSLDDVTSAVQRNVTLFFCSLFYIWVHGYYVAYIAQAMCGTSRWLRGLDVNVDTVVSSKMMKFQFWVNKPFNLDVKSPWNANAQHFVIVQCNSVVYKLINHHPDCTFFEWGFKGQGSRKELSYRLTPEFSVNFLELSLAFNLAFYFIWNLLLMQNGITVQICPWPHIHYSKGRTRSCSD